MVKNFIVFFIVFFIVGNAQAAYWNSNQTLNSGSYADVGWGNVTITIPEGQSVVFTGNGYGGGGLVLNGTLEIKGDLFQINGEITLGKNAQLIVHKDFIAGNKTTLDESSSVIINGTLQTNNVLTIKSGSNVTIGEKLIINAGFLQVEEGGTINMKNFDSNNPNNFIAGTVNVAETYTINNGPITMLCPGKISTKKLINKSSPNPIHGSGYIEVTDTLDGANPLTDSPGITLNSAGGTGNPGNATLSATNPCKSVVLPIVFGGIRATLTGNNLQVNWSTETEKNNDHFEIEISFDGKRFTKIGNIVPSKADHGNSDIALSYSFSSSFDSAAAYAISMSFLCALGTVVYKKRKNTAMFILSLLVISSTVLYACSKGDKEITTSAHESVWVRIAQYDKGSNKPNYSGISRAIRP